MFACLRRKILGVGPGLFLIGLAYLVGIGAVRVQIHHQRMAVLKEYDEAGRSLGSVLIGPERTARAEDGDHDVPWTAHLRRLDQALAPKNVSGAEQSGHEAYAAALKSRRTEGMVEVGTASTPIGAEAFAALRDREVVHQSIRIAESLAAQKVDAKAQTQLQAFAERMTPRFLDVKRSAADPF